MINDLEYLNEEDLKAFNRWWEANHDKFGLTIDDPEKSIMKFVWAGCIKYILTET